MTAINNTNQPISAAMNDKFFMLDADLLNHIKQAENGCVESLVTLVDAFGEGNGAKQDPELAAYFERKIYELASDNILKLSVLWNLAIRAKQQGQYETMKARFHKVIDFMQQNIPMEEWDFSLFDFMEVYTQNEE